MQPNVNVRTNPPHQQMDGNMNNNYPPHNAAPASGNSKMPWIVLGIVVIVVLAVLAFLFRDKLMGKGSSEYQAVFLSNGQVYFGKLSSSDGYLTLSDIFYLQVNQPLQSGQNGQNAQSQQQPQLSLVKLGNELHGPEDFMYINRSQVLFYENLKSDGKVVQAIKAYKANPNQGATGTGTQGTGTQNQTSATGTGTGSGTSSTNSASH